MARRYLMHRSAAAKRGQSNYHAHNHEPPELDPGAVVSHHVIVGIVAGHRGAGRLDRTAREQAHRGRAKIDAGVPTLPPHDLTTNRPVSEANSKRGAGNVAVRGRDKWERYASSRSATREHRHAANSSTATSTARHHGATGCLVTDHSDCKPLSLEE
jgi:hypothetical protein